MTGRTIARQVITQAALSRNAETAGVPDSVKKTLRGYYRAARSGEFATVAPTIERPLGRAPRAMRDVLAGAFS